jgi:spore germination protein GerM
VTGPRARPVALAALVAAAVLVLALSGCGISTQSSADRADPDDVPFGLLEEPASPRPATTGGSFTVYLVRDERLLAVSRPTEGGDPTLADVLRILGEGPTTQEQQLGIGSALPAGQIAGVTSSRGTAQVDLAASFAELPGRDQPYAIGQLVFTLTAQPGIGSVAFTLDGESIDVPRGDGSLTGDPLARDDFADLAPAR